MKQVTLIEMDEWDSLVQKTYGKIYKIQQQEGCMDRGTTINLTVPSDEANDEEMNDSIPETVRSMGMGVKFDVWLARDVKEPLKDDESSSDWMIELFWQRKFYPDLHTLANDMHQKGVLAEGDYMINIDW